MTFSRLARNNVRGNWQRYLAYFISCAVSVAIFYMFLCFATSAAVTTGDVAFGARQATDMGLVGVDIVIVIFSFVFMLYSTGAFIRVRKKEFGLLTLLGMTQRELRRMVFIELSLIAGAALLSGLATGILFARLFFMAMASLLGIGSPIPFTVPLVAVGGTIAVFAAMFAFANAISLFGVRRSSITELLKARRQPRVQQEKRPLRLLLGLVLTGAGYTLAWITNAQLFVLSAIPIILLTVAGTYFLVTQGALYICDWLRSRTSFYRRGINLLVVNRLIFRLTDNARAIFASAILIAVVGSALGTANSLLLNMRQMVIQMNGYPAAIELDAKADPAASRDKVLSVLKAQGVRNPQAEVIEAVKGTAQSGDKTQRVYIMGNAAYNHFAGGQLLVEPMALNPGQALQVGSFDTVLKGRTHVACGAGSLDAEVVASIKQGWLPNRAVIVLSDADFQQLSPSGGVSHTTYIGCNFTAWESHAGLRTALASGLGDNASGVMSRADDYDVSRRAVGLTMFIGVFIASLFFIAAGSLLYFKLFTELDEDRAQYGVLQDIGVTQNEVSRLVSDELGALFFVPLLIGAVHSGFALKTLANLFRSVGFTMSPFGPGLMIGGVYLAAQTIYYLVSARVYKRSVLQQG